MFQATTGRVTGALAVIGFLTLYAGYLFSDSLLYSADNYAFWFVRMRHWFGSFETYGSFQTWTPYINMGTSFFYNPTSGIFYPPTYVQLLVSPSFAMRYFWVAHVFLLVWGLYRWARTAGASRELLILIPVLAGGAGFMHVFSNTQALYLYAMVWSVWMLSELETGLNSRGSVLRFVLFWLLLVTNGEVFSVFVMGIASVAALAAKRRWLFLAAFGLVSVGLGLAVYGHSALVLPYTARSFGLDTDRRLAFSLHPLRLVQLFAPYFFGTFLGPEFDFKSVVNSPPYAPHYLFQTIHFPLPLVLLMLAGTAEACRRRAWLALALCAFALALSFGRWGLLGPFHSVPPFRFLRSPEKAFCVTSVLFLGMAIRYGTFEALDLRRPWLWVVGGLAVVLPFFSRAPDWPLGILSAVFLAALFAWQKGRLPRTGLLVVAVLVGFAQNRLARPPLWLTPDSETGQLSEMGTKILAKIPDNSFRRIEFAPGVSESNHAHMDLVYGLNMLYRRESVLGYDTVESPLIEEAMTKLFGAQSVYFPRDHMKPLSKDEAQQILQLTNLHLLVVSNTRPVPPLAEAVRTDAGVFRLGGSSPEWTFLESASPPHPAWWFPRLETWNPAEGTHLSWPPRITPGSPFVGGLEDHSLPPGPQPECRDPAARPMPIREASLTRIDEERLALDFEAPCEGWVFVSQHLVPGWILTTQEGEVPLHLVNGSLLGFYVKKGRFQGELSFHPWRALARHVGAAIGVRL